MIRLLVKTDDGMANVRGLLSISSRRRSHIRYLAADISAEGGSLQGTFDLEQALPAAAVASTLPLVAAA